jgi:hemerythrin-like domain-containing protein
VANLYTTLGAEHRRIEQLLEELESGTADEVGRRGLIDLLESAASRHEAGEEQVLWPAVRRRAQHGEQMEAQGLAQERDARFLFDALRVETSDSARRSQTEEIARLLRRHIEFEEGEVWPALRRATGPIGAAMMDVRHRLVMGATPTRPHPHGPDHPVALSTVGAATALMDRARDRLGGRSVVPARFGHGSDGDAPPDAIGFLMEEHARIEALATDVEILANLSPGRPPDGSVAAGRYGAGEELGRRWQVVGHLIRAVSKHDAIEREYLYPLLRERLERGNDLYPTWMSEHAAVAAKLAEVDRRNSDDPHSIDLLREVIPLIRTHIVEEEGAVLPAARAHLTMEERAELGAAMAAARKSAPSRPHSHVGGAGFGARLSRLVVGPVDRARDAVSRRR